MDGLTWKQARKLETSVRAHGPRRFIAGDGHDRWASREAALADPLARNSQSMKVAVFGKPGGGKSTLARQIATTANLPLQQLDLLQYGKGGFRVPDEEFLWRHAEALAQQQWVVHRLLVGHQAIPQESDRQASRMAGRQSRAAIEDQ